MSDLLVMTVLRLLTSCQLMILEDCILSKSVMQVGGAFAIVIEVGGLWCKV